MKILILGSTGMLGYSLFKNLSEKNHLEVYGTIRNKEVFKAKFSSNEYDKIFELDVFEDANKISNTIKEINPDFVINCIGAITQKESKKYELIFLNSLLPHIIQDICDDNSSKLIHFSTDCVFNGENGNYVEDDLSDAFDLYGKSKYLGEILSNTHLTIRTSIIGHELNNNVSLVDWFLSQDKKVTGYKNAIFSGFPCVYLAEILSEYIFDNKSLNGLMHIAAKPICKYDLLKKIANVYKKGTRIEQYDNYYSNKSLNSSKFNTLVGFRPPEWDYLINLMHEDYCKYYKN